jgi:hypothetical protein
MEDTRRPITDHFPLGPGAEGLSDLLDSLIALRLEIANAPEGEKALTATAARTQLMEVQATVERAIGDLRRALEATDRRRTSPPRRGDGEQRHEGFE